MSVFINIGNWVWNNKKSKLDMNPYWIQDITDKKENFRQQYLVFREYDDCHCLSLVVITINDHTCYDTAVKLIGGRHSIIPETALQHESFDDMMAYARLWGRHQEYRYMEQG